MHPVLAISLFLEQRILTFFYLSTPFGHASAVQRPLPSANAWLL